MSRRLHVLFVVAQPTRTSAISVHANLMRRLDPDRVEVHVAYNRLAHEEPYRSSGRSVVDLLPRGPHIHLRPTDFGPDGRTPRAELPRAVLRSVVPAAGDAAGLIRYIRRHGIDVIHCEDRVRNGLYAVILSRLTPARSVAHFHSKYGPWMSPLSRLAIQRAHGIITVSRWVGEGIHDEGGVPRQRIHPVLNGIDLTAFDPAAADGAAVRRELGLAPEDVLITCVAQLVAWKRQHVLIEAFGEVLAAHPTARLLLAGTEDGGTSYTERLRRQVAEAGLEQGVVFAGQRRDVAQILAATDVFCLPSVGDPCPLAHIEAMAMGCPAVAVRDGGTPEIVLDGTTGLLGAADDTGELTANLLALTRDPERRRAMGAAARQRAVAYLNDQRMARDVEAVYRKVSGRAPEPAAPSTPVSGAAG